MHCCKKKSIGKLSANTASMAVWKKPNSVQVWYIHWRPTNIIHLLLIQTNTIIKQLRY